MAITRSQIARQLLAEGGVSLDDAKRMAPEGEFLAYINPKEAQMLKDAGGSGIMTPMGIPSFVDFGGSGTGYGSAADTFSAASGNPGADSRSNFGGNGDGGGGPPPSTGGGSDPIKAQPTYKPTFNVPNYGRNISNFERYMATLGTGIVTANPFASFGVNRSLKEEQEKQKNLMNAMLGNQQFFGTTPRSLTTQYKETTGMDTGPKGPPSGGDDGGLPIIPKISPQVAKLPTDIEPDKSDIRDLEDFQQRFILPERFRLAEGGDVSVKDAEKMAPKGEFLAYINDDEAALLKSLGGAGQAVNETGIPSFFVKKLFKKAAKAVKKVVKSPIGKAALAGAAIYGLGGGFGLKPGGFAFRNLPGAGFFAGSGAAPGSFRAAQEAGLGTSRFSKFLGGAKKFLGSKKGIATAIGGASLLGGLAAGAGGEDDENIDDVIGRISDQTGIDVQQIRKEVQDAYAKGDISSLASKYPFLVPTGSAMAEGGIARLGYQEGGDIQKQAEEAMKEGFPRYTDEDGNEVSLEEFLKAAAEEDKKMVMPKRKPPKEVQKRKEKNFKKAKPALEKESADMVEDLIRSKKAGGGLMDLGGNEMDLRGGGFVPIGAKEKADDVPARLSKNEFVFTADAVRAAGGGSVEKGAQKMYNTMKQLEDSIA
jgi:predicted transcriptional regulator